MPTMKARSTMTANGLAYPLQGLQYETLPFNALCEFAVLCDTGGTVLGSVFSGTDVLMQNSQVDILAVASPMLYPDHYNLRDTAGWNERLSVVLQEGAGGTPVVRTSVMITPV